MLCSRFIILIALAMVSLQAYSAEWLVEPSVFLRAQYNDNLRMDSVNEEAATGYAVGPRLVLEGKDAAWDVKLDTKLRSVRYFDVSNVDSDNVFVNLSAITITEISRLGFNASYEDNSTLDLDYDTQLDLSDITGEPVERETLYFAPYWYLDISEKANMTLGLNTSTQVYNDGAPSNYNDYSVSGGNFSFGWRYSENTDFGINIKLSSTESDDLDYENDKETLQFSYAYDFSRDSALELVYGRSKVDYVYHNVQICPGGYTNLGFGIVCLGGFATIDDVGDQVVNDYSIDYTNKSELNTTALALSRNITASSSGSARQTDLYSIDYERAVSERVDFQLLLSYRESETLDGLDSDQDSKNYRYEPAVFWKLTEDWGLRFFYRHIKREYVVSGSESASNSIYINLSLRWPKAASTY